MRQTLAAASFALIFASPALADSADDFLKARELGQIVGGAAVCEYPLDDKASDLVSGLLAEMDPMARAAYQTSLGAQKVRLEKMTDVERKISCSTQAKVGAQYGILSK
ncbi:UNVERIFIED_ORG: hypothetical protein J2W66_003158 [Agrobacterium larrymoorei]|jgi:hypothetical protein|nr:hypothetical protein [Agrobacterium larrymoorei]